MVVHRKVNEELICEVKRLCHQMEDISPLETKCRFIGESRQIKVQQAKDPCVHDDSVDTDHLKMDFHKRGLTWIALRTGLRYR